MDTKQLLTFLTLADLGNYIKASERLNYAPSTLAKQIHNLESELGVPLVEHRENRIRLTPQGERFYGYAEKMLNIYYDAAEEFSDPGHLAGTVRIAGGEPIVGLSFSQLFLDFSVQYPKVAVNVQMICCARVPEWIRRQEVGIGCVHEMEPCADPSCACLPLYNEPILFVTTEKNPLAGKGQVLWRDLENQKFAYTYEDCCFTMAFRDRLRQQNVLPASELFLGSVSAVMNSVAQEGRIALIPRSSFQRLRCPETLYCLNWQEEPIRPWVQILYDKNRRLAPAEKELIAQAQSYARTLIAEDPEGEIYA